MINHLSRTGRLILGALSIMAKIIWIMIRVIGWIVYGLWLVLSPTISLAAEIAIMIAAIIMIRDLR